MPSFWRKAAEVSSKWAVNAKVQWLLHTYHSASYCDLVSSVSTNYLEEGPS
jgi:hypothetical protein